MGKKLIVANWKMHFSVGEASLFLHKLQQKITLKRSTDVVLCPHFLALQPLSIQVDRRKFKLGAQNCYFKDEGAFTGEVSPSMLRAVADYVIVGHSERRHILGEDDRVVAQKVQAAIRNGLQPILCVGETKQERIEGDTAHVIHGQVTAGLANVTSEEIERVIIAYEPVWAIGTGDLAKVDDVVAATRPIRKHVEALFGPKAADKIRILYGGSVEADTAGSYLVAEGIDGLLVGGASLKADSFIKIVERAQELQAA